MEKKQLPALRDLYDGDIELKAEQNKLNIILNTPPNPDWVKDHPMAKGVKYIPIDRIEFLLTRLFLKWWVEVKSYQVMANSCAVCIRLHYQNIENDEWSCQDGLGAAPIQTKKGAGAMDVAETLNDAIMKALPAAESYAIKDAAEKIGKIFGKDLNRKDEIGYGILSDAIPQERISVAQIGYADELIRTSTIDDDAKERAANELTRRDLTVAELSALINTLKENQPRKY